MLSNGLSKEVAFGKVGQIVVLYLQCVKEKSRFMQNFRFAKFC